MKKRLLGSRLIIMLTIGVLVIVFGGLWILYTLMQNFSPADTSSQPTPGNESQFKPVDSQLIILHTDKIIENDILNITATLKNHQFTAPDQLNSTVHFNQLDTGDEIGKVTFTQLGKAEVVADYQVRMINATSTAAQIVVTKVEKISPPSVGIQ